MERLGPLIRRLRIERQWSQQQLADRAGVSLDTISKGEQDKREWNETTAYGVLTALARSRPLSRRDARALIAHAGLASGADIDHLLNEYESKGLVGAIELVRHSGLRQRAHAMLDELISVVGPERLVDVLRSLSTLAGIAPPAIASASAAPFPPNPESAPPVSEHNPITQANDTNDEPDTYQTRPGPRRLVSQREGVTEHGVPYVEERYHYEQQQPDPTPPKPRRKTG